MERLPLRKSQGMSFSIRKLHEVMESRSPSDVGTGGRPKVRLSGTPRAFTGVRSNRSKERPGKLREDAGRSKELWGMI
ncbi:hypothetical protein MA16_Dca009242 [Dendrobium catenatum]|uniref:Uncharacterized protein n=1 Tax=Dendrobium catenatum TaxID=906689 RepID=A0A2I0WYU0_9ASPA|nr:hypothetical protein MA16_Dca009242 [Dendrobium catenatum]